MVTENMTERKTEVHWMNKMLMENKEVEKNGQTSSWQRTKRSNSMISSLKCSKEISKQHLFVDFYHFLYIF